MKKTLAIVLTLVLLLSLAPAALADSGEIGLYSNGDTKWIGSWGVPVLYPESSITSCTGLEFHYGYSMASGQLGDHDLYMKVNGGWIKYGTFNVASEGEYYSIWVSFDRASSVDAFALVPKHRTTQSYSWDGYVDNVIGNNSSSSSRTTTSSSNNSGSVSTFDNANAADDFVNLTATGEQKWIGSWGWPVLVPDTPITNCTSLLFHYGYEDASGKLGNQDLYIKVNGGWIKYGSFNIPREGEYFTIRVYFDKASSVEGFVVLPEHRNENYYTWWVFVDEIKSPTPPANSRSSSSSSSNNSSSTANDLSSRPDTEVDELYYGNDTKWIGSWGVPLLVPDYNLYNCQSFTFHYGYYSSAGQLGDHDLYIRVNGGWIKYGTFNVARENEAFSIRVYLSSPSTVDAFALVPKNRSTESYSWDGYLTDMVTR